VTVKLMRAAIEAAISGMSPSLSTAWQNVAFTPANGTACASSSRRPRHRRHVRLG
jgi:hypothetical protein